eukprot:ANDGO_01816.mRNA.1 hypothetical protein
MQQQSALFFLTGLPDGEDHQGTGQASERTSEGSLPSSLDTDVFPRCLHVQPPPPPMTMSPRASVGAGHHGKSGLPTLKAIAMRTVSDGAQEQFVAHRRLQERIEIEQLEKEDQEWKAMEVAREMAREMDKERERMGRSHTVMGIANEKSPARMLGTLKRHERDERRGGVNTLPGIREDRSGAKTTERRGLLRRDVMKSRKLESPFDFTSSGAPKVVLSYTHDHSEMRRRSNTPSDAPQKRELPMSLETRIQLFAQYMLDHPEDLDKYIDSVDAKYSLGKYRPTSATGSGGVTAIMKRNMEYAKQAGEMRKQQIASRAFQHELQTIRVLERNRNGSQQHEQKKITLLESKTREAMRSREQKRFLVAAWSTVIQTIVAHDVIQNVVRRARTSRLLQTKEEQAARTIQRQYRNWKGLQETKVVQLLRKMRRSMVMFLVNMKIRKKRFAVKKIKSLLYVVKTASPIGFLMRKAVNRLKSVQRCFRQYLVTKRAQISLLSYQFIRAEKVLRAREISNAQERMKLRLKQIRREEFERELAKSRSGRKSAELVSAGKRGLQSTHAQANQMRGSTRSSSVLGFTASTGHKALPKLQAIADSSGNISPTKAAASKFFFDFNSLTIRERVALGRPEALFDDYGSISAEIRFSVLESDWIHRKREFVANLEKFENDSEVFERLDLEADQLEAQLLAIIGTNTTAEARKLRSNLETQAVKRKASRPVRPVFRFVLDQEEIEKLILSARKIQYPSAVATDEVADNSAAPAAERADFFITEQ